LKAPPMKIAGGPSPISSRVISVPSAEVTV
jgi:hypothetical protein